MEAAADERKTTVISIMVNGEQREVDVARVAVARSVGFVAENIGAVQAYRTVAPRTLVARLLQGISNSDRADDTKPQEGEG
jgi:alpha-D-ribose 1-methylphosphonate 5-triphosphate synthase subunit PhnI